MPTARYGRQFDTMLGWAHGFDACDLSSRGLGLFELDSVISLI
jgi:hypothetical protein